MGHMQDVKIIVKNFLHGALACNMLLFFRKLAKRGGHNL